MKSEPLHLNFRARAGRTRAEQAGRERSQARLGELLRAAPELAEHRRELSSLAKTPDGGDFAAELFAFGLRRRNSGQAEQAAAVFARLREDSESPAVIRAEAEAELQALSGSGPLNRRVEILTGQVLEQATSYRVIAPMLGASLVGQLASAWTLGRLGASRAAGFLTRGWGARAASGAAAWFAESPAFAALVRLAHPDAKNSFSDDLQRSFLCLGLLKFFQGGASLAAPGAWRGAAGFAGLYLAQGLETRLGLRPETGGAAALADALGSWIGLGIGAHLGRRALGDGWAGAQQEMLARLSNPPSPGNLFSAKILPQGKPAGAMAGRSFSSPKGGSLPTVLQMSPLKPEEAVAGLLSHNLSVRIRTNRNLVEIMEAMPEEKRLPFLIEVESHLVNESQMDRVYGASPFHYALYDMAKTLRPGEQLAFARHFSDRLSGMQGDLKAQASILLLRLFRLLDPSQLESFLPALEENLKDPSPWVKLETAQAMVEVVRVLPAERKLEGLKKIVALVADPDFENGGRLTLMTRGLWESLPAHDLLALTDFLGPLTQDPRDYTRRLATEIFRDLRDQWEAGGRIGPLRAAETAAPRIDPATPEGAQRLISGRVPINYAEITGNHPFVYFGEYHGQYAQRAELKAQLPLFKRLGFTHLALEAFISRDQSALHAFQEDWISLSQLRRKLLASMAERDTSMIARRLTSYLQLVVAARDHGLRVLGIDLARDQSGTTDDSKFGGDEVRSRHAQDLRFSNRQIEVAHTVYIRNIHSALVLANVLEKNPGARILTLGGSAHYGYFDDFRELTTLNHLMSRYFQRDGKVVYFSGEEHADPDSSFPTLPVSREAKVLGLSGERFAVPMAENIAGPRADWLIHVGNSTLVKR